MRGEEDGLYGRNGQYGPAFAKAMAGQALLCRGYGGAGPPVLMLRKRQVLFPQGFGGPAGFLNFKPRMGVRNLKISNGEFGMWLRAMLEFEFRKKANRKGGVFCGGEAEKRLFLSYGSQRSGQKERFAGPNF